MAEIPALPVEPLSAAEEALGRTLAASEGDFVFPVYSKRVTTFCRQSVNLGDALSRGRFYERLRSLDEVAQAVEVFGATLAGGTKFRAGPLAELVVDIFPSMYDAPKGVVPMPEDDEESVGWHAVLPIEIEGDRVNFMHNWSRDWGDEGCGSFSLQYIAKFAREASSIRPKGGPAPPTGEPADAPTTKSQALRLLVDRWRDEETESPWMVVDSDPGPLWCGRWLIGVGDGSPWLQAAILLRGLEVDPLTVGWLHARSSLGGVLDIEEFFIWPSYRGRGLGAALAGQSLLFAAIRQHRAVRWLQPQADVEVARVTGFAPPVWVAGLPWRQADVGLGVAPRDRSDGRSRVATTLRLDGGARRGPHPSGRTQHKCRQPWLAADVRRGR